MTVYSLPLALHWLGAAFALDDTNMGRWKRRPRSDQTKRIYPTSLCWQVFSFKLALINSQAVIMCINPQMA